MKKVITVGLLTLSLNAMATGLFNDPEISIGGTPTLSVVKCLANPSQQDNVACQKKLDASVATLKDNGFTIMQQTDCTIKTDRTCDDMESTPVSGFVTFIK